MADDFDDPVAPGTPAGPAREKRPEPKRDGYGRYLLPPPGSTGSQSWQRATTLIKMASDTYHLELWKQRSIAKGLASKPSLLALVSTLDVKKDRARLNKLCEQALDAAGAKDAADLGTALHGMSETMDETGSMDGIPELYRPRIRQYNEALAAARVTIVPGFIERITVSTRYRAAGTLDRVYRLDDGTYVIGDLKTGSTLDFGFKEIEAQLALYEDGVNSAGVWTGSGWDTSVKVRRDFGLVVHLPSDGDDCKIYRADLTNGHRLLEVCAGVRDERSHKSPLVEYRGPDLGDAAWQVRLESAATYAELLSVVDQARAEGRWNRELADVARSRAASLV